MVRARIKTIGKSTSGFTLTEMLASIVIIAIMASIVIVNVTHSSVTSSRKSCQTDFRTVTAAVNAYQNDAGSLPVDLKALVSGGYLSDPEGSITSSNLIVRTSYQLQLNNGVIGIAGTDGLGFSTSGVSNCTSSITETQELSAPSASSSASASSTGGTGGTGGSGGTGGTGGSASPTPSPGSSVTGCTVGSCIAPTPAVTVTPAPSVSPSGFVPSATPSASGTYPNPATSFSSPTPIPTFTKGANKTLTITGINLTNVAGVWIGSKPVTSWSINSTYTTLTAVQPSGGQTGVHIYVIFTNGTWWTSPGVYTVG